MYIHIIASPKRRMLEGKDMEPKSDNAELLAEDPGIWTIPNFLNSADTIKLANLLEKYRDNVGPSPCSQNSPDVRNCIYFKENDLVNQNYGEGENLFYNQIRAKVQSLWPQFILLETNGVYDVPKGNTNPFGYHWDPNFECTTVIFLSDNDDQEGNVIFPFVGDGGLSVAPRKGMALTWLTKSADGTINESHAHGIQASPASAQLISAHNYVWGESSLVPPEEL